MNAARPADGLLSAAQTMALLQTLGQSDEGMTIQQAARDLNAQRAASYARTFNSIEMLEAAGLLTSSQDRVRALYSVEESAPRIAAWVVEEIADRIARNGAHALQLHEGDLVLDPMQLPGPVDGLRLWLIEFGIASRIGSSSRRWIIEESFENYFLDAARAWNRSTRWRISQAALEERLEQQAAGGALAEDWLLQRERTRLADHRLLDQVTRKSIENAAAGYDIESFSSTSVIVHDRFLEVKSFSGRRHFYWTRNEIERARELGEAYHLVIIDRDRMHEADYSPDIISAPYSALIETKDNGWSISPTTFECIPIAETATPAPICSD